MSNRQSIAGLRKSAELLRHPAARGRDAFIVMHFADDPFQFMERQRAGHLPGMLVPPDKLRFLLVKFVLNLADQRLQHVFERDDAERAAEFVHDDGKMQPSSWTN